MFLAGFCAGVLLSGCATDRPSVSSTPTLMPAASTPVYAGPPDEYFPRLAACLREAGWDVVVDPAGGMRLDSLTVEQRPAFQAAKAACQQDIGLPPPPRPLSESEIRDRYQYLLQARQCLMELGYTISEPPSVDAFIESWATGPWSPYSDVVDVANREQLAEANEKCPQQ